MGEVTIINTLGNTSFVVCASCGIGAFAGDGAITGDGVDAAGGGVCVGVGTDGGGLDRGGA